MVKLHETYPFEVKLGTIRSKSGAKKTVSFLRQAGRGFGKARKPSVRRGGGSQYQSGLSWSRRVVVKVSIVRMDGKGAGAQRLHLKYIERDSAAPEGERGQLYDRSGHDVDSKAFEVRGRDNRHQFRVIISPEDGREMESLSAFTKDVMRQMERDLDTKLDWVAADHYDTGQPHTHIVIRGQRDDGKDLVIPKDYITHGIRDLAEELVTIELGRVSEDQVKRKLAMGVEAERYTYLDRGLVKKSSKNLVDLSNPVRGQGWRAQLERERLGTLCKMGLATAHGGGTWTLSPNLQQTLTRMSERGDIIRGLQRAVSQHAKGRMVDAGAIHNPHSPEERAVTGQILSTGVWDDIEDRAYIVMDFTDGRVRFVDIGKSEKLAELNTGKIVTINPSVPEPKPSDHNIVNLASENQGRYSPSKHMMSGNASEQYVQAHIRRLEAMRRAGHVRRLDDGSWSVPSDYLERAGTYELDRARKKGADVSYKSQQSLQQMKKAIGATWLDEHLRDHDASLAPRGFQSDLQTARQARRAFLIKQGFEVETGQRLSQDVLTRLEQADLNEAAKAYGRAQHLDYRAAAVSGKAHGKLVGTIERPSGKYAILEKSHEFTLVPWRENMKRQMGRELSGQMRSGTFSWSVSRARGLSR